ncbi:MAG TPA: hypothetical protein VEK73_00365 [Xanthobacteraceae bacterium]|nr:hypothetical protein [Xanthobacteraceae bacterium]
MEALQSHDDAMLESGRQSLDPSGFAGRWINTNQHGRGISEIAIRIDRGRVKLVAASTAAAGLCAWGETEADVLCGSDARARSAMAFAARCDFGAFQTDLRGNLNLGLLVVASFNRVGPHGHDYFAREFYRRGDPAASPMTVPWTAAAGRVGGDDPIEADPAAPDLPFVGSEMFGEWVNTNPVSNGITRLRIDDDRNGAAVVRAWGPPLPPAIEGGPIPAALFASSSGSRLAKAFSARYEANHVGGMLQAYINQGVLVVIAFNEFNDGSGQSNYFRREFYYRT